MRWSRNATSSALTLFTRATQSCSIVFFEMRGTGFPAIRGSTTGIISSLSLAAAAEPVATEPNADYMPAKPVFAPDAPCGEQAFLNEVIEWACCLLRRMRPQLTHRVAAPPERLSAHL